MHYMLGNSYNKYTLYVRQFIDTFSFCILDLVCFCCPKLSSLLLSTKTFHTKNLFLFDLYMIQYIHVKNEENTIRESPVI